MTDHASQLEALWSLRQNARDVINDSLRRAGYRGITVGHLRVLAAVARGLDSSDIARHFGHTQQYVSRTIHICAESGLIELQANTADGRRVILSITDRGARTLRLFQEWQDRIVAAIGVDLTEPSRRLEQLTQANDLDRSQPSQSLAALLKSTPED